ncbi:MAG: class I SAM-dependent methyltransferase [Janthinobacterium lividum]
MPNRLAVTTSVKPTAAIEAQARGYAAELNVPYASRSGLSLPEVFAASEANRLLIVGADRLRLRDRATDTEYFFHPNLFQVRASNVLRNAPDHFLIATQLGVGDSIFDCTLGFASEASLASLVVGETGSVAGLESVPELALVTRIGVQSFTLGGARMTAALRRVQVVTADSRTYLPTCADNSVDVVYFDPFFEHRLSGSEVSVSPLFIFGNPAPLDAETVEQARRVARRRVVIKHPRDEPLPSPIAEWVTETVASRKSRVVYSVIA